MRPRLRGSEALLLGFLEGRATPTREEEEAMTAALLAFQAKSVPALCCGLLSMDNLAFSVPSSEVQGDNEAVEALRDDLKKGITANRFSAAANKALEAFEAQEGLP
eukprot:scaffold209926_cov33-Tisochrysis_lutea.AAC.1